jgi:hypothetical protein
MLTAAAHPWTIAELAEAVGMANGPVDRFAKHLPSRRWHF